MRQRNALVNAACALSVALTGALSSGLAFGQNPDFSTVTDILQGRRHLLRTDDVVVTFTGPAGFGNLATQNYILPTVDSIINTAGVSSYALVSHVSTPVHPSKTALGRQRRG